MSIKPFFNVSFEENYNIMIKNVLTLAAITATLSLGAQSNRTSVKLNEGVKLNVNNSAALAKPATQTCDSVVTMNLQTAKISVFSAGSDTQTPGCSPKAGYVDGTNCYGDKEKANFNAGSYYGSLSNASVTAVKVLFYRDLTDGSGTQGGVNATVGAKIYNGSLAGGPTGAALGTITNPMATVLASHQNTTNVFFFHEFTFLNPIAVQSSGFFAAVVVPDGTTAGDTAVIAAQVSPTANIAWEKWSDNSWVVYTASTSWQAPGNMVIIPKYCFELSGVGISGNMGISKSIDIYPNPSSGNVKMVTSFVEKENIEITISDMYGKRIYSRSLSTMIDVIDMDLSNQANGVYFVNVSNGTDRMVTRIVINK